MSAKFLKTWNDAVDEVTCFAAPERRTAGCYNSASGSRTDLDNNHGMGARFIFWTHDNSIDGPSSMEFPKHLLLWGASGISWLSAQYFNSDGRSDGSAALQDHRVQLAPGN